MSERALAFVEEWISDHITAKDAEGNIEARAKALADQCLADASKEGIPASEIGEAIDNLPDFMVGAIEEAEEREEHADGWETRQGGSGTRRSAGHRRRRGRRARR